MQDAKAHQLLLDIVNAYRDGDTESLKDKASNLVRHIDQSYIYCWTCDGMAHIDDCNDDNQCPTCQES